MKNLNNFYCLLIPLFFIACDSSRVFDENKNFDNQIWHRDSSLVFNVEITDTLAVYNIYLNNRISSKYAHSNLYLFIDTELPNKQTFRDTVECLLLDPSGKPLGKGFGNVWSNKIPFRKHIRFPLSGTYVFKIEQAMRIEKLDQILDAGLRIEKAKI